MKFHLAMLKDHLPVSLERTEYLHYEEMFIFKTSAELGSVPVRIFSIASVSQHCSPCPSRVQELKCTEERRVLEAY